MHPSLALLRLLPRNALSRLAGRVAGAPLPSPLRRPAFRAFGRAVGVDFSEVAEPLASFGSLQAFFTRALRAGVRPIDGDPRAVVSPCDGAWGASGVVERGTILQLKGRPYSLSALFAGDEDAAHFEGGAFATFYLGPRDYHRFHAPCDLRVERATYVPGTLWPVNRAGVLGIDGLFAENERICAFFRSVSNSGELALVAVGATMVGKVRVTFDSLSTNLRGGRLTRRSYGDRPALAKGQEWGRFEFGSTIVLVAAPGTLLLDAREPGTPLRLGTRIGRLT